MTPSVNNRNLWSRPLPLGVCAGIILAAMVGALAPAADMKPGDSRILMCFVGSIFLVPGCVATAYGCRFVFLNIQELTILRFVWLAAALFFTVAVMIGAHSERTFAHRFASEGRSTKGTVIETHPEDHDRVLVTYHIFGTDYRILSAGPRVARSYMPGESIRVYYLASAPAEGFLIEPRWRPDLVIASWILAAGVLPIWMTAIWGWIELHRRQKSFSETLQRPGTQDL